MYARNFIQASHVIDLVKNISSSKEELIDISTLSPGQYFVTLYDGKIRLETKYLSKL